MPVAFSQFSGIIEHGLLQIYVLSPLLRIHPKCEEIEIPCLFSKTTGQPAKTSQSLRWAAAFIKICAARSLVRRISALATARDSLPYAFSAAPAGFSAGAVSPLAARLLCRGVDWLLPGMSAAIVAELKRFGQGFGIAGRRWRPPFGGIPCWRCCRY